MKPRKKNKTFGVISFVWSDFAFISRSLAVVAGGSTFDQEKGFAEDDLLDGYEAMIKKLIGKNDFVLGITAGGHTR